MAVGLRQVAEPPLPVVERSPDETREVFVAETFETDDGRSITVPSAENEAAHRRDALALEKTEVSEGFPQVPTGDPMADGVTVQRASRIALEDGVTLPWILDTVRDVAPKAPVVLMSYLNPLLAYGVPSFARDAADAGVAQPADLALDGITVMFPS